MTGGGTPLPLALTMGEPAGIGGEIALKAWIGHREAGLPPFFLIDDPRRVTDLARDLGLDVAVNEVAHPGEAAATFADALPVLAESLPRPVAPGQPDPANAPAVLSAIRRAVAAVRDGHAAALVTNPIHKKVLADAGFPHPGHTEFLAELTGTDLPVMMLACAELRVVPVTIHLPLSMAVATLTTADIVAKARVTARALVTDFGIDRPRLAVCGLNPHAGEGGMLGHEEETLIAPAVAMLREDGIAASGPAPADSLFHAEARKSYDAAICMYHDQALIPLKTIDFTGGVDVTLGLPVVRTSPDHGTAFPIAGRGVADASSLMAALRMARDMADRRAHADQRVA